MNPALVYPPPPPPLTPGGWGVTKQGAKPKISPPPEILEKVAPHPPSPLAGRQAGSKKNAPCCTRIFVWGGEYMYDIKKKKPSPYP